METAAVITVLVDALYLLALINPMSKVSVLSILASPERRQEFRQVTNRSTLVAGGILLGAMVFGNFVLQDIFHVELHSLRLAGGSVLCWVGFNALRRGVFFEQETNRRFEDMAMVPLACPMIAGPATIAACIALRAKEGVLLPALSLIIALAVNHLVMLLSQTISATLSKFNVLGALIRITGLVVMTIGAQMVLDGLAVWLKSAMS
jgi:multiple antibiotic resistance protein